MPTRYLGNLLIAGGLMQAYARHCAARGIELLIVLDESFRELLGEALPPHMLLFYPRRAIARAGTAGKLRLYLRCLRRIRRFRADLAFNLEEDAVSHRLTQLSGAGFRLGSSPARQRRGYEGVLPIRFDGRPAGRRHRWHAYADVFAALGMEEPAPGYLRLSPAPPTEPERRELASLGVDFARPLAVLHAGATKDYKRWPAAHFAALARLLGEQGMQPVFIGAGADRAVVDAILEVLNESPGTVPAADLCDRLSLPRLAALLTEACCIVGNDSGPFHLGAALGLPGVVIFGPTEVDIWRPLSDQCVVAENRAACAPECSRRHCALGRRCLQDITPETVLERLKSLAGPFAGGPTPTPPARNL